MRYALLASATLATFAPSLAFAQFGTKPVITPNVLSELTRTLNIQDFVENAQFSLEFRATVGTFETYEYELSYDNHITTETTTVTLVRLDEQVGAGASTGTVRSGELIR